MKLNKKRGWIALAVISVALSPMECFAQRGRDDADSNPEARGGNEPPRLMRGGIMQQLRSVTDSVIGPFEDKQSTAESRGNVPKPPPLGQTRRLAEPRQGSVAQPRSGNSNSSTAEAGEGTGGQGRDWAGQFLIPNHRFRDLPGGNLRAVTEARRNSREEVAEQSGAEQDQPEARVARQSQVPTPPPLTKESAPRRVTKGQPNTNSSNSSPSNTRSSNTRQSTGVATRMSDPIESQEQAMVTSKMSDTAEEPAVEAPSEVAVSQVPDVPYVPRKPLPRRDGSQLLEKSLSAGGLSSSMATPSAKSASTANDKTKSTPSVSSTPSTSDSSASSGSSGSSSSSGSSGSGSSSSGNNGSSSVLPLPSVPSVPSLEISKNLQSPPSMPQASVDAVKARPVSTPAGAPLPSGASSSQSNSALPPAPPSSLPTASLPTTSLPTTSLPTTSLPTAPALTPMANTAAALPSAPQLPAPTLPSTALPSTTLPSTTLPSPTMSTTSTKPSMPANSAPLSAPAASVAGGLSKPSSERLNMEIPHVAVKLLGPGDLNTNTPTAYELVVINSDRIALSGLILRMETPPGVEIAPVGNAAASCEAEKADDGATLLTWNVAKVLAGGNARLPLQLKAATARNFAVAIEWTVLPQAGIHQIEVKQAELQVALEGPVDVEKDVTNAYRLKVSNPGSAVARRVKVQVIAGNQPANQIDVGDLDPGQTELVEMDLTFEKAGRIQIAASGAAEGGLKRDANIAVAVHQPVLEANLAVPASVPHGSPMIATVQIKNSGDAAARKLQAGLMLPPGSEFGQLPAGMNREGNKLLWNIDSLPPGEVATVPIEVTLPSPGDHEIKFACVHGKNQVTNAAAMTNVEAFSDLKLVVNDPVSPAPVGSAVNYEIVVTNRGSREARDVAIVAQFSDGIEPESATGLKHRVVPGQVLFDSIPRIAAGESVKLKVAARAAVAGLHRFRVEVRTDETDAKLVEEEATRFLDSTGRVAAPPSTLIQR